MRVLQVVTDTDRRGAQVFASDLHAGLADLGWDVETVALTDGRVGGLDLRALGPRRRAAMTIRRARQAARSADVVVAHGSTTLPVTALAMIGLDRPIVYRQVSDSLFWAPTPLRRARVRMALSRTSIVVALWEGAARVLAERFGVPDGKIRVIPNGVRAASWTPASADERVGARRRLGLGVERPVVTFAAAMVPEKGPDLAVETVAALPDAHLLMVGGGPEEARIRALGERLLGARATFVGVTSTMRDVYAATDVLLFPSRGGDSMPAVVIEAGLMGVPTVATDTGALPAMIDPEETGIVVSRPELAESAVRELLAEPERRRAMGLAARDRFLQRYDIGPVSRGWAGVLESAVSPGWDASRAEAFGG